MRGGMSMSLVARDVIKIHAAPEDVWAVLTEPEYIIQWDEFPDGHVVETMRVGNQIIWRQPNGGQTILKVVRMVDRELLKISLYSTNWPGAPTDYAIHYCYLIREVAGVTILVVVIGDFAALPNGMDYYEASIDFANVVTLRIKQLAETKEHRRTIQSH